MKLFILEDNIKRIEYLRNQFIACEIQHSACTKEAISILCSEKFDIIFLDHDLSEITDWQMEGTGYEVAYFLGNNDTPNNHAKLVVHSMNPEGSEQMMLTLRNRAAIKLPYADILIVDIGKLLKEQFSFD
jgi:CheY-like chemotaxis protein